MGSFFNDMWESLWTGWTPIVTLLFFLVGVKLSAWMAGYFNTGLVWFLARFAVPVLMALAVPFFAMSSRNKR